LDHKSGDDAAIYKIDDQLSLVLTLDFFAPIVDDGYTYGEIAAANSLSDVYAVGGRPVVALNIAAFPRDLPKEVASSILEGGFSKAREANTSIVGGHTIDDKEPKYGLAVTGFVKTGKQITNALAKTGDLLILTKPIGTGIITTALKNHKNLLNQNDLNIAIDSMRRLNNLACDVMNIHNIKSATDITGFGLLGHLDQMMKSSNKSAIIWNNKIPFFSGSKDLLKKDIYPMGTIRNLEYLEKYIDFPSDLSDIEKKLLADPQTSGGMLMAVPEKMLNNVSDFIENNDSKKVEVIGEVTEQKNYSISVHKS
jgi:selenide,water dikinase|tara:strand:+ start:214 stop:1143 length:930 start_codon:yes stop_codon:yes gene_type:complete